MKRSNASIVLLICVLSILFIGGCAAVESRLLADSYISRGVAYYDMGRYDRAVSDFTRAMELAPGYAVACYNRGLVYMERGQYDLAVQDFDRAIELDPGHAGAYYKRGVAHKAMGLYDRAVSDFGWALGIKPGLARAYYERGEAYYSKGEYGNAWRDVQKARDMGAQVDPEFLKALREALE